MACARRRKQATPRAVQNGQNQENGFTSEENGEEDSEIMGRQDPEERRQIRHKYRAILLEADEKKEELGNYKNVHKLRELLERGNAVHKDVRHTREAALDSQVLVTISQLSVESARGLPMDFHTFNPLEFAEKLKTSMGNRVISRNQWFDIGQACSCFFKRNPPLKFMFGSFKRDPPQRKEKKQRMARETEKDKEITKPKEVERTSELGRKEATTEEVDYVNNELKRVYGLTGEKPICYFEFVVDPESFGHTIENMFYVSFLVKDGHCRVFLDDDKLPVIEPLVQEPDEQRREEQEKQQVIITVTQEEWRDIIEVFNIQSAILTRRRREQNGNVSQMAALSLEEPEQTAAPSKKKKRK